MDNMLDRIVAHKAQEVENAKKILPLEEISSQARMALAPRGFIKAIKTSLGKKHPALIAEIKKASPSKGLIREDFDPSSLAVSYEAGGATCISVLTDVAFFQGHPLYLKEVLAASTLPVLRKDFMIDPYQVVEARAWGADCILVIMAALDDAMAQTLINTAHEWGMDVLVEVHNREELERALKLNAVLIGINNRNLQTFEIKLEVTEGLAPLIPQDRIVVSESGITTPEDLTRLQRVGVGSYLVGESLMRQDHVENATRKLLGLEPVAIKPAVADSPEDTETKTASSEDDSPSKGKSEAPVVAQSTETNNKDEFQNTVEELGAMMGGGGDKKPVADNSDDDGSADASDMMMKAAASKVLAADGDKLTHVNEAGEAHMVDISTKTSTQRVATAEGFVHMKPETLARIQQNTMKKGDVLATARIAGIMAAKNTPQLIPLCHPIAITGVDVSFTPTASPDTGVRVVATVKVNGLTGVEMEALTAVSVACLTIYDMGKAIDKAMHFSSIRLLEKTGGKSGIYRALGPEEVGSQKLNAGE